MNTEEYFNAVNYELNHQNFSKAQVLINRHPDSKLNAQNDIGSTLLHIIARNENSDVETTKLLIKKGAIIDSKNFVEETPLHNAAYSKNIKIAELLIYEGAKCNIKNLNDKTPLDIAKSQGDEFYNQFIDVLANKINNDSQKAEAFAMATHDRLGAESPVNSLIPDLVKEIVKKAVLTLDDIPEGEHRDAVKTQLKELQKNVGTHTAKVTEGRSSTPPQGRS